MHKNKLILLILIIFHLVGLIGMSLSQYRPALLSLSGMNLILSFVLLVLARKKQDLRFYLFLVLCFTAGLSFEWIGVHTGYLFGNYHYGTALGTKVFEVPWVIGLNWCTLVICSSSIASRVKGNPLVRAIVASLLMLALDFLIEPVAQNLGYWKWENGIIPVYNYLCWFGLSLPLTFLYAKWKLAEQNTVAIGLYVIFVLFFGILRWTA